MPHLVDGPLDLDAMRRALKSVREEDRPLAITVLCGGLRWSKGQIVDGEERRRCPHCDQLVEGPEHLWAECEALSTARSGFDDVLRVWSGLPLEVHRYGHVCKGQYEREAVADGLREFYRWER